MALYGRIDYWNERYQSTGSESYDWYQNYQSLRHLLTPSALTATTKLQNQHFPPKEECRVLLLGCGNSTLCEELICDGWKGPITNLDFSPVVLQQLQQRLLPVQSTTTEPVPNAATSNDICQRHGYDPNRLGFVCVDATVAPMPFADEAFDLIICKGTLDAVLCGAGSTHKAKTMIAECARMIQDTVGVLFLVTYGNPDSRVEFLEYQNDISHYWKVVNIDTVPRHRPSPTHVDHGPSHTGGYTTQGHHHNSRRHGNSSGKSKQDYIYICRKRAKGDLPTSEPSPSRASQNQQQALTDGAENAHGEFK